MKIAPTAPNESWKPGSSKEYGFHARSTAAPRAGSTSDRAVGRQAMRVTPALRLPLRERSRAATRLPGRSRRSLPALRALPASERLPRARRAEARPRRRGRRSGPRRPGDGTTPRRESRPGDPLIALRPPRGLFRPGPRAVRPRDRGPLCARSAPEGGRRSRPARHGGRPRATDRRARSRARRGDEATCARRNRLRGRVVPGAHRSPRRGRPGVASAPEVVVGAQAREGHAPQNAALAPECGARTLSVAPGR